VSRAALLACVAALGVLLLGGLVRAATQPGAGFPHVKHERLFPVCESCHAGVTGDRAEPGFPEPALCARCHDGERKPRVSWQAAAPKQSMLSFAHAPHDSASSRAADTPTCQSCHALDDSGRRMAVGAASADHCVACHAHRATEHMADAVLCSRCHLPLADVRTLGANRIAAFPQPDWHRAPDFISSHGLMAAPADATCAVCHARETCERCHANADRLPLVQALRSDARVGALEAGRTPLYPTPESHLDTRWRSEHGRDARRSITSCGNCHTTPSCTRCHTGTSGRAAVALQALPAAVAGGAQGVDPARIAGSVHGTDVKLEHGALAASGRLVCAQCHAQSQCASCHAAADSRAFHLPNFAERHAVDVFSGRGECQACHSTETFCRACHAQAGVAAKNMNASFHDGQPMWVLSHGQAARRALEACASCHSQSDCVRCHSATGGWGVSPHGPGFGSRGDLRSTASCRLCHRSAPVGGAP
jgi:hypothetical protein